MKVEPFSSETGETMLQVESELHLEISGKEDCVSRLLHILPARSFASLSGNI